MMNVIEIQDALKGMPMEQLIREMQMPSGQAPQFLVLGEIARRKQMEKEFAQRQGQPQTTVAQDAIAAAGAPQGGIADMARSMAPQTDMAMNTAPTQQLPVQGMAGGGYVQKMQAGGIADRERAARRLAGQITPRVGTLTTDPRILQLANAFGVTVAEAIRMVENNPQLLAATETPSAMVTTPGVSARPTTPVDSRILPAGYDDVFSRIGRYDEPAMPESLMRPVGGSLSAVPPRIPPLEQPVFDPTARAAAGREAGASRVGMSTAEAARQANEAKRIREAMDLFTAENLFQKTDNQPGEATTISGRNIVSVMPGAGAAPTMPDAPDQPGLPALLAAIGGGASQAAPRIPVGAQNLPLLAGLGDTMRGQEDAAVAFDAMRAEQLRREEEALAAQARRDVLPFTSVYDPVVSAYSGEEGQFPRDPTLIMPEAPLPEEAVGTLRSDLTVERPAYDLFRGEGIGAGFRRAIDRANAAYERSKAPEVETLEGGTTPADAVAAPPLPPGRVAPPSAAPAAPPGGIAAAMSPFETELTNLLQQRGKRAEQDKWLALAQTGLALMGSRQPTFAGALGEAGAAGLQQFQQGRAQYDKDRLELMALLENTRLARAKLAAAGRGGGLTAYQQATLARDARKAAVDDLKALTDLRATLTTPDGLPIPAAQEDYDELTARINQLTNELYGVGSGAGTGGVDFATSSARAG